MAPILWFPWWLGLTVAMVTVVILAEDKSIQDKLAHYDLKVQTVDEVAPIQVYPARVLSHVFAHLGKYRPRNTSLLTVVWVVLVNYHHSYYLC